MTHDLNYRDDHPLCGARKRNGETCRAFAGQGTDHHGVGRCKFHGGATRTHRQGAVVTEAKQRMVALGQALDIPPHEALLTALHLTAGHVAYLNIEVSQLPEVTTHEARVLVELHGAERDRMARIAKACIDAGVEAKRVQLAEQFGEQLADFIKGFLGDLVLTKDQERAAPDLVRRHLARLEALPLDAAEATAAA
ncbi:MAG: hypothetical protein QOE65_2989 [Solirubrobacteraceae bacterium]|jgi:hypothetical protein|nr:hypothetical protein [Solirubrobacteraceae bacterium]